jgi:hypothetical protein
MEEGASSLFVYSRRLQGGHVYVGVTSNLERRGLDPLPLWVERHGPEDGDKLLPIAYVQRDVALGLEDQWTARLMWALGVNRVRGGTHTRPEDYTLANLESLSAFLRHNLQLNFIDVERRLCGELKPAAPQGSVMEGVLLCITCKQARSFKGPLCPRCFYLENTCAKCGDKGHIDKWCGTRALMFNPEAPAEWAPKDGDDSEEALTQFLEAVDAAEAEYKAAEAERAAKRSRESSEGELAPASQQSSQPGGTPGGSSRCIDCTQSAPAGKPRCYSCWLSLSPCFFCAEMGHMRRSCPRLKTALVSRRSLGFGVAS